jgi:hypothetical protein
MLVLGPKPTILRPRPIVPTLNTNVLGHKPIILGPRPIVLSQMADEHPKPSTVGKRPKVP